MTETIDNDRNTFLMMAFFFNEIYHSHQPGSLMMDEFGYVLKMPHSRLLSFCTQGFRPELQNPLIH